MERSEAWKLINEHLKNANLIKHSLAVEACMIAFAQKFGADTASWGLAGLLHDLDYEYTVHEPLSHTHQTVALLRDYNLDPQILNAIMGHNNQAERKSKMDWAMVAIDPATGFITACALMHPSKKLDNVDLARMKKRFKEKSFAKGACREQMLECDKMGVDLDEFLGLCLKAMQGIHESLGL